MWISCQSEEYESDPLVQELLLKSVNVDESFDRFVDNYNCSLLSFF